MTVSSILIDRGRTVWVGTQEGGLARLKKGAFEAFGADQGLADNLVLALAEDHEDSLWIGTMNGLTQLVDSDFVTYRKGEGLPGDIVLCTYEDRAGHLWAGTTEGVAEIPKSGHIRAYSPRNGLPGPMVLAVHEDLAGNLWLGIQGHGIARLHHGRFERVTMRDGLICNNITSFCDASDGGLWVGTPSGLSLVQGDTITNYALRNGSTPEQVMSLASGRDGSIWVGTDAGTLHRFKGGAWTNFGPQYGSPAVSVTGLHSIYEDKEGTLWIGSADGLIRFKDGKSAVFSRKNGLFHDFIYQVLEDDRGRLWMTCDRGVFAVSKAELKGVADGSAGVATCRVYDASDGMKSAECNGGGSPAGCRLRDGRLCFPTMMGVAVLDPTRVPVDTTAPPTAIEGIKADGVALPLKQGLRLHAGVRRIELQYTALSFRAPEKLAFRYKLLRYDKDWIEAGTHREAYYTNLRPGAYSFSVAARSRDGGWTTSVPALRFTVQPFFYQTETFIILCVLAAFGAIFAVNRLVVFQLRARNAVLHERTRIARDIHDTVAQGLASLALQLDTAESLLATRPEEANLHLARARELVEVSLEETRRAIRALRPRILGHEHLPAALQKLSESMSVDNGAEVKVEVTGRPRHLPNLVMEDDLWGIAREAIVNSLRHGKCEHVWVTLDYSRRTLLLTVRDDGAGFVVPADSVASTYGLLGMRERAQMHGWNLELISTPGEGTRMSIVVPLSRKFLTAKV
jgi:signal transduction histidine kinase/streptogramin lyase